MEWWTIAPWWAQTVITLMAIPYVISLLVLWVLLVDWLASKAVRLEREQPKPAQRVIPLRPFRGHTFVGRN